jgi:hypothetical protein
VSGILLMYGAPLLFPKRDVFRRQWFTSISKSHWPCFKRLRPWRDHKSPTLPPWSLLLPLGESDQLNMTISGGNEPLPQAHNRTVIFTFKLVYIPDLTRLGKA